MKINLVKQGSTLYPLSQEDEDRLDKLSNATYTVNISNLDLATRQQQKSLHLWCTWIANLLNENSLYMVGIFGNKIEWSMPLVKEQIIKATIKKVFGINSTTKLKRKEIDEMTDYVTQAFGLRGVEIPEFPNRELWNV